MLRHFIIAALRNMAANRLQSAIAIIGLSIGIAAALLMALIVRNQVTSDRFIPGHERTYLAVSQFARSGQAGQYGDTTPFNAATLLKWNAPGVENTTRLMLPPWNLSGQAVVTLKQGPITAEETIYWADPNMFDVLPLPVFAGNAASALRRPDGIVLPRAVARKYFGRDDVVGRTILLNGHPMTVRAVIEDLPANGTSLRSGIFASGLASFSPLAGDLSDDASPVITFVRLKPGAGVAAIEQRLPGLFAKAVATKVSLLNKVSLVPLDRLALFEGLHPGAKARLAVTGMVGVLILLIAAINFVNLLTARAARRAKEVGVRKVCGAARRWLVLQFLGESILTVFFAACLALALSEWSLPLLNAFLGTGAKLDYEQDPQLLGLLLAGVVALGLLVGAWPALVLSSFRPAGVLKGLLPHRYGADAARNALVVVQFAILIGLTVAATVIHQQNRYATREGLHGDIDRMLVMRGGCKAAFRMEVRKLAGVAGADCTDITFLQGGDLGPIIYKGQRFFDISYQSVDPGIFALYGIGAVAGSVPPASSVRNPAAPPRLVLNKAAVKRLGFASPQEAIGQALQGLPGHTQAQIAAVVPDFSFHALADQPIPPSLYTSDANPFGDGDDVVSIRLKGCQLPETLAAIDRVWRATNPNRPADRFFLNDHMQQLYLDILRQAQLFTAFSAIAAFLACLGLLALSMAAAERRTKEVGIRKAMGAGNGEIQALLLWQFARPVLWANLIAWPAAWWALRRWLSGFAYHVPLNWWLFPAVGGAALLIALLTVALQTWLVARQKPVLALRYE